MYNEFNTFSTIGIGIGGFLGVGLLALLGLALIRMMFMSSEDRDGMSMIRFLGVPVGGFLSGLFGLIRALLVAPAVLLAAAASPIAWALHRIRPTRALVDGMARGYAWVFDRVTRLLPSPVMKGDLEEVWRVRGIGADQRPELHRTDIPHDIRRPLWRDGYTVLDESLVTLADARIDPDVPVRLGRVAALASLSVFTLLLTVVPIFAIGGGGAPSPVAVYDAVKGSPVGGDFWPGAAPETAGAFTALGAAVSIVPGWLTSGVGLMTLIYAGASAVVGSLVSAGAWWHYQMRLREPYAVDTRDLHRSARRFAELDTADTTYRRAVDLATGYERGQPLLKLGEATGHSRMRGDPTGPQPGQAMTIDKPALFQHLAVVGGTGEGKTTAIFSPTLKWWLGIPGGAAVVMDDKAAIWKDVKGYAEKVGRGHDVRVIGTDPDHYHVDLLAGLEPQAVVQILQDMSSQVSGGATDGFFEEMAMTTIRHALVVASAVERTEEGRAWTARTGKRIYSLGWVYSMLTSRKEGPCTRDPETSGPFRVRKRGRGPDPVGSAPDLDRLALRELAQREGPAKHRRVYRDDRAIVPRLDLHGAGPPPFRLGEQRQVHIGQRGVLEPHNLPRALAA